MHIVINYSITYFILTHIICILFFTLIYYQILDNSYHYTIDANVNREEYIQNKFINALFLSFNLEATAGFTLVSAKSNIAKIITMLQLLSTIIISLGVIYIKLK